MSNCSFNPVSLQLQLCRSWTQVITRNCYVKMQEIHLKFSVHSGSKMKSLIFHVLFRAHVLLISSCLIWRDSCITNPTQHAGKSIFQAMVKVVHGWSCNAFLIKLITQKRMQESLNMCVRVARQGVEMRNNNIRLTLPTCKSTLQGIWGQSSTSVPKGGHLLVKVHNYNSLPKLRHVKVQRILHCLCVYSAPD